MEEKKYENVMKFMRDGYADPFCGVLLRCMERHVNPDNPLADDADDLWYLSTMLKSLLADEHGLDLDSLK